MEWTSRRISTDFDSAGLHHADLPQLPAEGFSLRITLQNLMRPHVYPEETKSSSGVEHFVDGITCTIMHSYREDEVGGIASWMGCALRALVRLLLSSSRPYPWDYKLWPRVPAFNNSVRPGLLGRLSSDRSRAVILCRHRTSYQSGRVVDRASQKI